MANNPAQAEPEHYQEQEEEGRIVQVTGNDLAVMTSAEIDTQIATAKKFPRSLKRFRDEILQLATADQSAALSCIYSLPRDGKMIEGPSARFAEILAACWGNNRTGGRVVGLDDEFITGQGFFLDLEKNTAITYEVKRRITDKHGRRYGADMLMVTGNAAASIAHRNAVLKGVPQAIWTLALDRAKEVIKGDAETFGNRKHNMFKQLNICGVSNDQVYALLGVKGFEDVNLEHMVKLGGLYTAVKEGELSVDDAFPVLKPGEVAPPRPNRSDFTRQTSAAGGKAGLTDEERKARIKALGEAALAEEEARARGGKTAEQWAAEAAAANAAARETAVPGDGEGEGPVADANSMLEFLEEMIAKGEEGTRNEKDLDELKEHQVNALKGMKLSDAERSHLVGRLNGIILSGKANLKKKARAAKAEAKTS